MGETRYRLLEETGSFDESDVLEVTARWGDWHLYDVRLEPVRPEEGGSIKLTERRLETITERVPA